MSFLQVVGFAVGYMHNRFEYAVFIVLAASALLVLFAVPAWPFLYRQNEPKWLAAEIPKELQRKKDS